MEFSPLPQPVLQTVLGPVPQPDALVRPRCVRDDVIGLLLVLVNPEPLKAILGERPTRPPFFWLLRTAVDGGELEA